MGVRIRQQPIHTYWGALSSAALLGALLVKVALTVSIGASSRGSVIASVGGAAVFLLGAGLVRWRYPTFMVQAADIRGISRRRRPLTYRLHLSTGAHRDVLLTPNGPAAEQLASLLPHAFLSTAPTGSSTATSTYVTSGGKEPRWEPISRAEARGELRRLTGQEPAPHGAEPPTPPSRIDDDHPGAPGPTIDQWRRDDEYAQALLAEHFPNPGGHVGLRLLSWVLLGASFVYLAQTNDIDTMGTTIGLWSAAFAVGLLRGVLRDRRAARVRATVRDWIARRPELRGRGAPEPWTEAIADTPSGVARLVRAALRWLLALFAIGILAVVEEEDYSAAAFFGVLEAAILGAHVWLSRRISRTERAHREEARALAGPRAAAKDAAGEDADGDVQRVPGA